MLKLAVDNNICRTIRFSKQLRMLYVNIMLTSWRVKKYRFPLSSRFLAPSFWHRWAEMDDVWRSNKFQPEPFSPPRCPTIHAALLPPTSALVEISNRSLSLLFAYFCNKFQSYGSFWFSAKQDKDSVKSYDIALSSFLLIHYCQLKPFIHCYIFIVIFCKTDAFGMYSDSSFNSYSSNSPYYPSMRHKFCKCKPILIRALKIIDELFIFCLQCFIFILTNPTAKGIWFRLVLVV